jgi:phage portal protein BeeE
LKLVGVAAFWTDDEKRPEVGFGLLSQLAGRGRRHLPGPDADQVEALSSEREALWARIGAAAFLTDDEKRAAVGYGSFKNIS